MKKRSKEQLRIAKQLKEEESLPDPYPAITAYQDALARGALLDPKKVAAAFDKAGRDTLEGAADIPRDASVKCGIGSSPGGPLGGAECDLPWGHKGDQHASEGDGYYAPSFLQEHRRRQKAQTPTTKELLDTFDAQTIACPKCGELVVKHPGDMMDHVKLCAGS